MTNIRVLPATIVSNVVWTRTDYKLPELSGLYLTCTREISVANTEIFWTETLYYDVVGGWRYPEDIYEEYPEAIEGEILYWAERPIAPIQ